MIATVTRDRRLLGAVIEGETISDAAESVGISRPAAYRAMDRMERDGTIAEIMERAGITPAKIAEKLKSKMNARETKFFADKGIVKDQRTVVAHGIQLDATKFAARMLGIDETDRPTVHIGIGMSFAPIGCQLPSHDSNSMVTATVLQPNSNSAVNTVPVPTRSTVVGTGRGRPRRTHQRRGKNPVRKRSGKKVTVANSTVPAKVTAAATTTVPAKVRRGRRSK